MVNEKFAKMEKLYHYTTFDTALVILRSHSLRFGRLSNMNDIHESSKNFFIHQADHSSDFYSEVKNEILKYRQISFSCDKQNTKHEMLGFNLHQMWGLYGDKGKGICFVFDKQMIDSLASSSDCKRQKVIYAYDEGASYILEASSNEVLKLEIANNMTDLFFRKRKEWEHEQEYRIIKRFPDYNKEGYLDFKDALKYVIMSGFLSEIDEYRYNNELEILNEDLKSNHDNNIPVLIYENGLLEYCLKEMDGNQIWSSENGYNILQLGKNCQLDI